MDFMKVNLGLNFMLDFLRKFATYFIDLKWLFLFEYSEYLNISQFRCHEKVKPRLKYDLSLGIFYLRKICIK